MEEQINQNTGKRGKKRTPTVVFLMLAVFAVLLFALWELSGIQFLVALCGETEAIVYYGDPYEEQGATPVLKDRLFWKSGVILDVPVDISGQVNTLEPGKYFIKYESRFRWWHASNERMVRVIDTEPPVIELIPDAVDAVCKGGIYQEAGFAAYDNHDGDITDRVIRREEDGIITYAVTDSSGNPAYAERIMPPAVYPPPEFELVGGEELTVHVGDYRKDPGFKAVDCRNTDITDRVTVEGDGIWYLPGKFSYTYTVKDDFGNSSSVTRSVEVLPREKTASVIPEGKVVYLTFDDGPGPYTDQLLDILKRYNAKATFFVTDSGYESQMKRIVEEGHTIAIHTKSHNYEEIYESQEAFFDDLLGMQDIIQEITGVKTWLMRFPGGSSNTVSRFNRGIMTRLTRAVEDAGFRYCDWDVDSGDTARIRSRESVFQRVIDSIPERPYPIVLQHDIHQFSVEAVEDILCWGIENGYSFLPMDETTPVFHHFLNN